MKAIHLIAVPALALLTLSTGIAQTPTSKIVSAANAFLGTLDGPQKKSVMFAFDDQAQRTRWSNFPITMVPRAGLAFKDMTPAQHTATIALLAAVLSPRGLQKVQEIMDGDEVNKTESANGGGGGGRGRGGPGGRGGGLLFGKDLYYISFLGAPNEKTPWILQFGGHHLALNITIAGEHGVLTPTLTGAQPALYTRDGKTVRPLAGESDKAIALLNALDDNQKKQAILGFEMRDLVLGPGQDGKTIQPEGLKATGMNDKQRAMMLDIMSEWAGIINETAAAARMAELKADINDTWFAWAGPTTVKPGSNITAYYRIQGPHVVIEYAPQELGGDPALHVHTMYRDPTDDYGKKFVTQ